MPAYDEKYMKAKVRGFNGVIKTIFLDDKIPKENKHYTCIEYKIQNSKENEVQIHRS